MTKVFNFHQRGTNCPNPIISQIDSCHNNLPKATKASKSMPFSGYSKRLLKKKIGFIIIHLCLAPLVSPAAERSRSLRVKILQCLPLRLDFKIGNPINQRNQFIGMGFSQKLKGKWVHLNNTRKCFIDQFYLSDYFFRKFGM